MLACSYEENTHTLRNVSNYNGVPLVIYVNNDLNLFHKYSDSMTGLVKCEEIKANLL